MKQRPVVPVSNEAPRLVGTCALGHMYIITGRKRVVTVATFPLFSGKSAPLHLDKRKVVYTAFLDGFEEQDANNHVTSVILHIN